MNKFIVFTHYLILASAFSLPFWLDWEIVAIIMIAYYLVFTRWIGYCPLTVWQFGTAEEGFIEKHIVALFRLFGFPKRPSTPFGNCFIRETNPLVITTMLLCFET